MKANGVDWKEVKLGNILRYLDERLTMDDEKEYLTITVKRRHGGLEIREKLFGHQIATKKQFRLVPGAFIISRVQCWHQAYAIVGDVPANMIASTNYDQFAISPEVDPRFFWWLSHSPAFTETVRSSAVGVVIEKMVFNRDQWLTKSIRLPPLAEQRRVVARINELAAQIYEARTLRHQTAEEAKALSASAASQLFSSLKSAQQRALADVCHTIYRYPTFFGMPHLDDGVPVVRGEHIQQNGHLSLDWSDYWHVSEDVSAKFPKTVLRRGDLVMSVRGSIGKLGIVGAEHDGAQLSPNCIRFAPTKAVESRYLFLFLRSPLGQEKMSGHSAATAIATIRASNIKNVALPVPPLPEQRRVVAELDALQAEVNALKRLQTETAAELDALLSAILDRAFKGEL